MHARAHAHAHKQADHGGANRSRHSSVHRRRYLVQFNHDTILVLQHQRLYLRPFWVRYCRLFRALCFISLLRLLNMHLQQPLVSASFRCVSRDRYDVPQAAGPRTPNRGQVCNFAKHEAELHVLRHRLAAHFWLQCKLAHFRRHGRYLVMFLFCL